VAAAAAAAVLALAQAFLQALLLARAQSLPTHVRPLLLLLLAPRAVLAAH
jgi:hypothetical protein